MASNPTPSPNVSPQSGKYPVHFGGSMSPAGHLSPKPRKGRGFRTQQKLDTIARLENANFPPTQIAAMLGVSVPRIKMIQRSADYINIRVAITHGIIIDHNAKLATIQEQRREILKEQMPLALLTLVNELHRPATTLAERAHKTRLAQDLMDREGTFAKITRTEIKPVDAFDFEQHDRDSRAVLAALRAKQPVAAPTEAQQEENAIHNVEAMKASAEFSRSHTLSAVDQQKALQDLDALQPTAEDLAELEPGSERLQ